MGTNKKQTAVEWLVEQITYSNEYGVVRSSFHEMADLSEFIDQAKQMEREQIEISFTDGFSGSGEGYNAEYPFEDHPNLREAIDAKGYFDDTYGKET